MEEQAAMVAAAPAKRVMKKRPKVIGLKALESKKYDFLEGLPDKIKRSFGKLVSNFIMIVWGQSGSGKSNFIYEFLKAMMVYGNVLYVSLEEGTEASAQLVVLRHMNAEAHGGKIFFADHEMKYDELVVFLKRKKSPRFVVIDSVQYWDVNYVRYKALKETFPGKTFIFISHAMGKNPDGKTADKIRYDAGIKVHVEGYVANVICRYGGNRPYIIWEEGALGYWKKKKLNEFKK